MTSRRGTLIGKLAELYSDDGAIFAQLQSIKVTREEWDVGRGGGHFWFDVTGPATDLSYVDALADDADGMAIDIILHTVDGLLQWAEWYRVDGEPVLRWPPDSDEHVPGRRPENLRKHQSRPVKVAIPHKDLRRPAKWIAPILAASIAGWTGFAEGAYCDRSWRCLADAPAAMIAGVFVAPFAAIVASLVVYIAFVGLRVRSSPMFYLALLAIMAALGVAAGALPGIRGGGP